MKILTLGYIIFNNKILLGFKKRGFGADKWNGYGGKLIDGEKPIDGLIREIQEESSLIVPKNLFKKLGYIDFYFSDKKEWNQRVIIYRVDNFECNPAETEEMKPGWFSFEQIPYKKMWIGDEHWLPYVVSGKNFTGKVHFSDKGKKLISCQIQ